MPILWHMETTHFKRGLPWVGGFFCPPPSMKFYLDLLAITPRRLYIGGSSYSAISGFCKYKSSINVIFYLHYLSQLMIGTWSTGEEDMVLKTFPSVECSIFSLKTLLSREVNGCQICHRDPVCNTEDWSFVIVVCTPPSPSSSWFSSLTTLTSLKLSSAWAYRGVWAYLCPTLTFAAETLVCEEEKNDC